MKGTPGPRYDPGFNQKQRNTNKYSFGYRRDVPGYSALNQCVSTGTTVGPGSYFRYNAVAPNTSIHRSAKACKFPMKLRFNDEYKKFVKNETYETYRAVAPQTRSQKRSEPNVHFTKARRDKRAGVPKDALAPKPIRVVIPMPKMF